MKKTVVIEIEVEPDEDPEYIRQRVAQGDGLIIPTWPGICGKPYTSVSECHRPAGHDGRCF